MLAIIVMGVSCLVLSYLHGKTAGRFQFFFPFYIINTEKRNNFDSPHRSLTTNGIENEQFDKNMQKLRNEKCLASKIFLSKGFARHAPHERALIT